MRGVYLAVNVVPLPRVPILGNGRPEVKQSATKNCEVYIRLQGFKLF